MFAFQILKCCGLPFKHCNKSIFKIATNQSDIYIYELKANKTNEIVFQSTSINITKLVYFNLISHMGSNMS